MDKNQQKSAVRIQRLFCDIENFEKNVFFAWN